MKKRCLLGFLAVTLCHPRAWTADMIATPGHSTSPYAPVNEKQLAGGIIKLHCAESDFAPIEKKILAGCIKHAEKQIKDYCEGPYRIVKRAARLDGEQEYVGTKIKLFGGTLTHTSPGAEELARYLVFACGVNSDR